MLSERTGDLFELNLPAIGHGCNCVGAMGAGIAVEFRKRYPRMYDTYRAACQDGSFTPGMVLPWEADGLVIYNLATQPRPGPSATLAAISMSVRMALMDATSRGIRQLGLPRIGAGLGGLSWPDVRATLEAAAASSVVELVVVTLPAKR